MDLSAASLAGSLVPRGRCRALLAAAIASSALSAVCALVPAVVLAVIAAVSFDHIDIGLNVMQVVFAGIAAVIARLGFLLLARNAAGSATEFLSQSLRARAAVAIGALPLGVIAEIPPGSFETVLLDDVETLGQFVSDGLVDLVGAVAMLAAAFVMLLVRDWRGAVTALAVAAGAALLLQARTRRAAEQIERERIARERLAAAVFGALRAVPLNLTLPAAPDAVNPVRALADEDRRATDVRLARTAALRVRRGAIAAALPAAIVIAFAALSGTPADIPVLVLFAALGLRVSGSLACVFRAGTALAPARESARRIRDLLNRPAAVEGDVAVPRDATLRFNAVGFAYPGAAGGRQILRDIDFVAEPGRVTAIVGPSGSGKTTLTRLAARLWDPDSGSVTLGGIDLRRFGLDDLMRHVSCVFQDVALLDDTVAANLKLGRPDASDTDLRLAADAAGAGGFIGGLPQGFDTLVGDRGLHLSRGERQRLQIARALVKDAPVVILDEPTASMDPATELEVQAALAQLFSGKTVIVVAHRLATIAAADRIVVLGADGRIEAHGAHADLLARSATYARLWADYRATSAAFTGPGTAADATAPPRVVR